MSSRFTLILAGIFLVGALIAGYWGLVLSRPAATPVAVQPPPAQVNPPAATVAEASQAPTLQAVAVLVRDVPAFTVISPQDVALEHVRIAPAGSLHDPQAAIGHKTLRALSAGTWLNEDSFSEGGPLARMIRSDERALAVAVDEVIGAAGQLSPGDYVDVMLYLRQDQSNPQQSAQLVIPALRVLSVGEQMGAANDGTPAAPPVAVDNRNRRAGNTMVLAVPQSLLSRLMLASQAGVLRLAVRSAEEQRLAQYWSGTPESAQALASANRELLQFNQLAMTSPVSQPRPTGVAHARPAIEVIRGNQITQQTP
ncbi:MAG: Flp pilus assembly protein CpaB [Pseudomonas sp.]|nr:Flp pilus assembly protein CpaB [Pseudomonas sp.]